jgi:hypothetical protein
VNLQNRDDLEIEKDRLGAVFDEIIRGAPKADWRGTVPAAARALAGCAPPSLSDEHRRHADLHRDHESGRR